LEFHQLISAIERHSPDILEENGDVYFGGKVALREPNGIALVGLNPGGIGLPSIRNNLEIFLKDSGKEYYSGFIDQCWHEPEYSKYETCGLCKLSLISNGIVHLGRHQKMILKIAEVCGFDLRKTVAINAIWTQTRTAYDLRLYLRDKGFPRMEEFFRSKFFPIFQELFRECRTRLIICLGNGVSESSFSFFRAALKVAVSDVVNISTDYRDGRYFMATINGLKTLFFGIPHPSLHTLSDLGMAQLKKCKAEICI